MFTYVGAIDMARPRLHRSPLTVKAIEAALKQSHSKDTFLWDGTEHGLGVKITPAGSAAFIFQKVVRGSLKRITMEGKFRDTTLDHARLWARKLNGTIANGRDPAEEKREAERRAQLEKTVQDLWDRYETEVLSKNKAPTVGDKRRKHRLTRSRPILASSLKRCPPHPPT